MYRPLLCKRLSLLKIGDERIEILLEMLASVASGLWGAITFSNQFTYAFEIAGEAMCGGSLPLREDRKLKGKANKS